MKPFELLMEEHRLIERVLEALLSYADEVEGGGGERARLARFTAFLGEFADRHHHHKEEELLFTEMVRAGFSRDSGPIAVMLYEHDQGRGHVRAMQEKAEQAGAWSKEDRAKVAQAARGFAELLRAHIMKEEHVLYPMAIQSLEEDQEARLSEAVARFEREHSAERDRLRAAGEALAQRGA